MTVHWTPSHLLDIWERGLGRSPSERAMLLLEGLTNTTGETYMLSMPLGKRDEQLLMVRERLFGTMVQSVTLCPQCQEPIELKFPLSAIQGNYVTACKDSLTVQEGEWDVQFHNPTTKDLLNLEGIRSSETAKRQLLSSCIEKAVKNNERVIVDQIPQKILKRIEHLMEENDPYADRQIQVQCPACQHDNSLVFDITEFLWKELERYALHLLRKVHCLAGAYGWSERDILNMTPTRQDMYLELVEG